MPPSRKTNLQIRKLKFFNRIIRISIMGRCFISPEAFENHPNTIRVEKKRVGGGGEYIYIYIRASLPRFYNIIISYNAMV